MKTIEQELDLGGVYFQNERIFTKNQLAHLLEIDERTIERYLHSHGNELSQNGYKLLKGKSLNELKNLGLSDINVGDKAPSLGIFTFRALLNFAMLVTESEKAKEIRSRVLDIVIDVIAQKAGGHTKYINQRDGDYLPAAFQEENYRKKFTSALYKYVENFPYKFPTFTDKIYQSIFKEKAKEYKKILKLHEHENVRETMYSEVLDLIAAYENGLAHAIENKFNVLNRKLNYQELKTLFQEFEANPSFEPLVQAACTKMASRDLSFRDALHEKLKHYIKAVSESDYERFLGEKSKALEERIAESLDVYKRLRDR